MDVRTREQLLYLIHTNNAERLIEVVRELPAEVRQNLDNELKSQIGSILKEHFGIKDEEVQEEQVQPVQVEEPQPQVYYDENKYLNELTNLCNSLGIRINSATTSKNGMVSPYISFDLRNGFNPFYDNMLINLSEEDNIDMRFSRKYQNEFDFIIRLNSRQANMGYIYARLVETINSTNVQTDYSKLIPGDLYNLKKIYLEDSVGADVHQVIYTKLPKKEDNDQSYAYIINTDVEPYLELAKKSEFTECASGTNIYKTMQLVSYDKDDATIKLDYIASNLTYLNTMYNNMLSTHNNEVLKQFNNVPFDQMANVYKSYRAMDNGNGITSLVVATPLDDSKSRIVKMFRPTAPAGERMQFIYTDGDTFDTEILPKLVSSFAGYGKTKTSIGVISDTSRVYYQAMSDYGDTISFANMKRKTVDNAKSMLNETNRIYHHVQRDMITEYERAAVVNGFLMSILLPFMMAFTGIITIAMIIKIIVNS